VTLDRELPAAPDAERAVIGAALINASSVLKRIASRLSLDDFHRRGNRIVWKAINTVFDEQGDANLTLVLERLRADGDLEIVGGADVLSEFTYPIPDIAGVENYLLPLHKATVRRRAIRVATSVVKAAYDGESSELQGAIEEAARLRDCPPCNSHTDDSNACVPVPLSAFLSQTSASKEWLIEGLLPQGGIALLVAKPKVGKSTISRDLTHALVTGRQFLSRQVIQGRVLFLALEDHSDRLRELFWASGLTGGEDILVHVGPAPRDGIHWLANMVDRFAPSVVVDPLFKLVRVGDANAYAETSTAFEGLTRIARGSGAALLLVHHANKGSEGGDSVLGSTSILGLADTVMLVKRYDDVRTIKTTHRYGEDLPETVIEMDRETGRLHIGGAFDEAKSDSVLSRITEALGRAGHLLTEPEIRDAVQGDRTAVANALRRGVKDNVILRNGAGKRGQPFLYGKRTILSSSPLGERQHRESGDIRASDRPKPRKERASPYS
jgi:hypothetical protein